MAVTVEDFKAQFVRDFPYTPTDSGDYVTDADITRAFGEADMNFNAALFSTETQQDLAYLYLSAHYLVLDMRMGEGGINAQSVFNVSSKSVGNVSVSYAIPEAYTKSARLEYYSKTPYGLKYLSFVLPRIVGNAETIEGETQP